MCDRQADELRAAIATRLADYRFGEIEPISEASVAAWISHFDAADRLTILQETHRLLGRTYISRATAKAFVGNVASNPLLVGPDPGEFWRTVGCLRIQEGSASQLDMLELLNEVLQERFGHATRACGDGRTYLYLDDVCCSGNRIKNDLLRWLEDQNIRNATIYVVCIASYALGEYNIDRGLATALRERGCRLIKRRAKRFENRLRYARESEVFWPSQIPNDDHVRAWMQTLPADKPLRLRPVGGGGSRDLFSSEEARGVIEQAFFKKGALIYSLPQRPKEIMRPLGYSVLVTPGFGATIVTYRNCPNNAPLVWWWGDPNAGRPLSQWTPLLPRRINNRGTDDYGF